MAVTNGPVAKNMWIGLSTDAKPLAGVEFSAQFYEYDTGKTYIWTGSNVNAPAGATWVEYIPLYPVQFFNAVSQTLS